MSIGLSITTCKRLYLFERTINSFSEYCEDKNLFSKIFLYDDSSSNEDSIKIISLVNNIFPGVELISYKFNISSFDTDRRHLEIMKIWKKDIESCLDYVFHLEDDWLFERKFNISDGVEILKSNDDIGLIGYSWKKKNFPPDLFTPRIINGYWEWFYSDKYHLNEALFMDDVAVESLPEGYWMKYINWPYFGFRPGLHDVGKLSTLNTFNDSMEESFELEFAVRFARKYKTFLHPEANCHHIGTDVSSYHLNNSKR